MLKHAINDLNDVDESLRGFYKEVEGQEGLTLDVEAYTDNKVNEKNKALESKVS